MHYTTKESVLCVVCEAEVFGAEVVCSVTCSDILDFGQPATEAEDWDA